MKRTLVFTILLSLSSQLAIADPPARQSSGKRDSVWQGAVIGGAAGVAGGLLFTRSNCGPSGFDRECEVIAAPIGFAIFLPAGIVTGILIDRAIGSQRVMVAPMIGAKGAGLSVTLKAKK